MHPLGKLKSVLLIDDDGADNYIHRIHLESSGLIETVHEFLYADEALEYLQASDHEAVDLIFLDIHLPRMDGFEFLRACRDLKVSRQTEVVLLATHLSPHVLEQIAQFPEILTSCSKPLTKTCADDILKFVLQSNRRQSDPALTNTTETQAMVLPNFLA
ncbi:Sensory/regulatory protein RpfC [Acaryochloris thomasi RCC1774]|uniref:Sensory/regulatory protein RpfC n=1 Tax=Acaryochloris thomasi RCC1774 TaxID=1764569 RepID=A0A2W1JQC5_9CYAN|nr:response regulator [Acaryochloris thomasi]PZD73615.1 Sensory/regulatory protein RpfC [Acaryochloris thomasi RCC1774]